MPLLVEYSPIIKLLLTGQFPIVVAGPSISGWF